MTRDEFDQRQQRPCDRCQGGVIVECNPNNNALQVVCGKCQSRVPWRDLGVVNLKQHNRTSRTDYPMGEDLDAVWARYGDVCIMCGASGDELKAWGVGRQRQHVAEYRTDMHRGPILPICSDCHPFATQLQKMRALLRHSRSNGHQSSAGSRAALLESRLSPHPVRPTGETPAGGVERFPDDDADR